MTKSSIILKTKIEKSSILVFGAENSDRGSSVSGTIRYGIYDNIYDQSRWASLFMYNKSFLKDLGLQDSDFQHSTKFNYYLGVSGMDPLLLKAFRKKDFNSIRSITNNSRNSTSEMLRDNIINWNEPEFWVKFKKIMGNKKYKIIFIDRKTIDYMISMSIDRYDNVILDLTVLKNIIKYLKKNGKLVVVDPTNRLSNAGNIPLKTAVVNRFKRSFDNIGLTQYEEVTKNINKFFIDEVQFLTDTSVQDDKILLDRQMNGENVNSQIDRKELIKPLKFGIFTKTTRARDLGLSNSQIS